MIKKKLIKNNDNYSEKIVIYIEDIKDWNK